MGGEGGTHCDATVTHIELWSWVDGCRWGGCTHHDATIMHVKLCLWVGWVWVRRVVLTMMPISHMLSCVSGWMGVGGEGGTHYDATITHVELCLWVDGCGWGGWYSP